MASLSSMTSLRSSLSSCLPSSSSRPFHFSRSNNLVKTLKKDGTVLWNHLDLDIMKKKIELYDLEDLFNFVEYDKSESQHVLSRSGANRDPTGWMRKLCQEAFVNMTDIDNLSFEADMECKQFTSFLMPFLFSLTNRPDGVVYFRPSADSLEIPLLVLEIHSSPYKNSVSQTAVDVLDQLRLLRCFKCNISECVGYTFPKYDIKTCVTKVTVAFTLDETDFYFNISLMPLKKENVKSDILGTLRSTLASVKCSVGKPSKYFIQLTAEELDIASRVFGQGELTQVPTPHSVVLRSSQYFWKIVPNVFETYNLLCCFLASCKAESNIIEHVAIPQVFRSYFENVVVFRYQKYLPPLRSEQVSMCLKEFLLRTATALIELHTKCRVAHLDIRIPNICFIKKGRAFQVVLIDLDRCRPASDTVSEFNGEMYSTPGNGNVLNLDWKQLGLLAARIIFTGKSDEKIVSQHLYATDECLSGLISEGSWKENSSSQLLDKPEYNRLSLDEVLSSREEK